MNPRDDLWVARCLSRAAAALLQLQFPRGPHLTQIESNLVSSLLSHFYFLPTADVAAQRALAIASGGSALVLKLPRDGDEDDDGGATLSSLSQFSLPPLIPPFLSLPGRKRQNRDWESCAADLTSSLSPPSRLRDGERSEHGGRRAARGARSRRRGDGLDDAGRTHPGNGRRTAHEADQWSRRRGRHGSRRPRDGDDEVGAVSEGSGVNVHGDALRVNSIPCAS